MRKKKQVSAACTLLACVLAVGFCLTACSNRQPSPKEVTETNKTDSIPSTGQDKVRMAFLYNTSANDGGFGTSHDLGRQQVDKLSYVETTYLDNVFESDGWKSINDLAEQGYDIIVATSYGYMDDVLDVASKHPNVVFEHCSGYLTSENVGNYYVSDYDCVFLLGMASGAISESNQIGFLAPFPTPQVLRGINSFALGAKTANPDAVVRVAWTLSWYDPPVEIEASESLVAAGCDVLGSYLPTPTVLQTAEKQGVFGTGMSTDMSQFAPNAHLTSAMFNWGVMYEYFAEQVYAGTWQPESIIWGMDTGALDISPLSEKIPENSRNQIEEFRSRMKAGDETALPFYLEVKDQNGEVRIEAGRSATIEELLSMDYLVENVKGEIPDF